jgi:alpha-mannosidase
LDKIFHLIPNTHWDREWLYNFQDTRLLLVQFIDKLLQIFNDFPDYRSFLLDAQSVPIEDYLHIRPEKKDEIIKRVKENRLFIGPWYTLPEEHLVNGESLVRNLLIGNRVAEAHGGVMKIGYSPFSYGQASQMPQIYQGFDIDTIMFYHGIQPYESDSEFILEGPDGSQLLGSRMSANARYNFFFSIYRPLLYRKSIENRNYKWSERGLPFHLCSTDHYQEHHFLLDPVKNFFKEDLPRLLDNFEEEERSHHTTQNIACMQGMDSTQPDEYELKAAQAVNEILKKGVLIHSSLKQWIDEVKSAVKREELTVLKGERRTPRPLGTRMHLFGDVTSARNRIKRKNARVEQELQRKAEPFAAIAYLLGCEYPKKVLDVAWKYLLKCHPHDSISGTGIDQIERDMHYRLDQCQNISSSIKRLVLQNIQLQIDNEDVNENEILLSVFNPSPYRRSEVVTAVLDLPLDNGFTNYDVRNASSNQEIELQEICRYEHPAVVRHLGDATMEMHCLRVHVHIFLSDIPALGYQTFVVTPKKNLISAKGSLISGTNSFENKYLKVSINPDGTIDILEKDTQHLFAGLHYFEDVGEAGHAWRHIPPEFDQVITSLNSRPKIKILESGPILCRFQIEYEMHIPCKLQEGSGDYVRRLEGEGNSARRSEDKNELHIKSEFVLHKDARGLAVKTTFVNSNRDHRLRVMFPTNLTASHSAAEEPYDVVQRVIDRGPDNPWRDTWNPTHPQQRFVDVSDGNVGLAVINDGLREYEVTDNDSRTIGLTLLRAFEVALTTVARRWERHPEMIGSQSLGAHEFRYLIYPHIGDWDEGMVTHQADMFNVSLELAQAGPHGGYLPQQISFIELTPAKLLLSCIKRCEDRESIIIRIFNPTEKDIRGILKLFKKPVDARYTNLNEKPLNIKKPAIDDKQIHLDAKTKKIISVELMFNE